VKIVELIKMIRFIILEIHLCIS